MKLLIVTQKVDKNDPILGFFHRWIEEFAKHCEKITVICLEKGEYDLPKNVKVLSLGKENFREEVRPRGGAKRRKKCDLEEKIFSKLLYVLRFYRHIWRERKNYDTVFVHMNQEYILLGGLVWRLWRKKIAMWRNHQKGTILTNIAVALSSNVFCTSTHSYTAYFKKTSIMPVGIDIKIFSRDNSIIKKPHSVLFLGRISPVKNVGVFIKALYILDKSGVNFIANVFGDAIERDQEYYKKIRNHALVLEEKGKVVFHKGVPNTQTPMVYNKHEIYVNATPSGSFDKTILEAMACECITIVSNKSMKGVLSSQFLFKEKDAIGLAEKLTHALSLSDNEKREQGKSLRKHVENHSLSVLVNRLFIELN